MNSPSLPGPSASNLTRNVAFNLRKLRLERRMTVTGLAGLAAISPDRVRRIEGQRSIVRIETLEQLAIALEVPLSELLRAVNPDPVSDQPKARRDIDRRGRKAGMY